MRIVVQRIRGAQVHVGEREVGRADLGLLLLVGISKSDSEQTIDKAVRKIMNLRIFNDEEGKMNLSLQDFRLGDGFDAQILAVSNFTVYGDASKQNRPSFIQSAPFEVAKSHFDGFVSELRKTGIEVQTGEFGADMRVSLINDGPVTLLLDID